MLDHAERSGLDDREWTFDPAPSLGRSFPLSTGIRVRLRYARPSDRESITYLFADQRLQISDADLGRLVRFDPRRRLVICATALLGTSETIVGVGSIELEGRTVAPSVVVDPRVGDGLRELLGGALAGRARALAARRAA